MPILVDDATAPAPPGTLSRLLNDVYVGEGYTAPEIAASLFDERAVRQRGHVLLAMLPHAGGAVVGGMVVVVPWTSPARRLAAPGEAEMHLLAVAAEARGQGVGAALIAGAIARARQEGARRMILWTQPTMRAAHRLYARAGFVAVPGRDFTVGGRAFSVHELPLREPNS